MIWNKKYKQLVFSVKTCADLFSQFSFKNWPKYVLKIVIFSYLQSKRSDPPKLKGDKELKPASMRVKDAAEAVLACMLDHVVSIYDFPFLVYFRK